MTSGVYPGRIERAGSAPGLESADAICNHLAGAASLGGSWVALLSTDAVNASERITGTGPFVNMRGEILFTSRAALLSNTAEPMADMAIDENGNALQDYPPDLGAPVWTGSGPTGSVDGTNHCVGWTSADGSVGGDRGRGGWPDRAMPDVDREWISAGNATSCDTLAHLYCFEQP